MKLAAEPRRNLRVAERATDWIKFPHALELAAIWHANQYRKGTTIPYVSHLLAVCSIVIDADGTEDEAIAALLHDAVEDQGGVGRLDGIREEFGATVAQIVKHCSDSMIDTSAGEQKADWWTRKREYISSLREADASTLLVSSADKLHNAKATASDIRKMGEDVWKRFNPDSGRPGQFWYYLSLIDAYRTGTTDSRRKPIVDELERTVASFMW